MSSLFIEKYESQTATACDISSRVDKFVNSLLEEYKECSTIELEHVISQAVMSTCVEVRTMRAIRIRHAIRIATQKPK